MLLVEKSTSGPITAADILSEQKMERPVRNHVPAFPYFSDRRHLYYSDQLRAPPLLQKLADIAQARGKMRE